MRTPKIYLVKGSKQQKHSNFFCHLLLLYFLTLYKSSIIINKSGQFIKSIVKFTTLYFFRWAGSVRPVLKKRIFNKMAKILIVLSLFFVSVYCALSPVSNSKKIHIQNLMLRKHDSNVIDFRNWKHKWNKQRKWFNKCVNRNSK